MIDFYRKDYLINLIIVFRQPQLLFSLLFFLHRLQDYKTVSNISKQFQTILLDLTFNNMKNTKLQSVRHLIYVVCLTNLLKIEGFLRFVLLRNCKQLKVNFLMSSIFTGEFKHLPYLSLLS